MIVTDTDGNELRRRLLAEWGGWIETVYDVAQLPRTASANPRCNPVIVVANS